MSTPGMMMEYDSDVDGYDSDVDGYDCDNSYEEEDDNNFNLFNEYLPFDEYRNDVLYDYHNDVIYNEEYNSEDEDEEFDDTFDE
jgi:hypothetical protein